MPNSKISGNRRKLAKLFKFIENGGGKAEAARLFGLSRAHIYRLLADYEKQCEAEALDAVQNTHPFAVLKGEDKSSGVCIACNRFYWFPARKNFIKDICSVSCFDVLKAEDDKDDETRITLALAAKPSMIFPITEEQKESPEGRAAIVDMGKPDNLSDLSDLIE